MLAERDVLLVADEQAPWWPSRYGADDQIGSINEITPLAIVAAARLVRHGKVFDLGRVLDSSVPHFRGRFWQQTLVSNAHLNNPARPGGTEGGWGKNQVNWLIELATGTFQIGTQLDGLNHLQIGDRFYNGHRARDIVEDWGTNRLGIESVPPIITRGVLVDVARHRGVARMSAGDIITVDECRQSSAPSKRLSVLATPYCSTPVGADSGMTTTPSMRANRASAWRWRTGSSNTASP
jgi:hypothetical protein